MNLKLILASSSVYRKSLLSKLLIPFESQAPHINETPYDGESAQQTSLRLAIEKAKALENSNPSALIIGSDQVAVFNGTPLGKPMTHEAAVKQLRMQSGNTIVFYTSVCLLNTTNKAIQFHSDRTEVEFRELSNQKIEQYLLTEKPYDCAGSAKSEGLGITLLKSIKTTDPNALIGLPLIALCSMLENEGVFLP